MKKKEEEAKRARRTGVGEEYDPDASGCSRTLHLGGAHFVTRQTLGAEEDPQNKKSAPVFRAGSRGSRALIGSCAVLGAAIEPNTYPSSGLDGVVVAVALFLILHCTNRTAK